MPHWYLVKLPCITMSCDAQWRAARDPAYEVQQPDHVQKRKVP